MRGMAVLHAALKLRIAGQLADLKENDMSNKQKNSTKSVWLWPLAFALIVLLPSTVQSQSETVKLGDLSAISNAAIYIAIEKGFFKEQGINTDVSNFASAAKMVPALVAGELEVSVGSASAGLLDRKSTRL